jgi:hypothetical protein
LCCLKNILIILFIIGGIILPFIFLKDVYPFHRFGMFAEPVKHQAQNEKFYIFYKIENDTTFENTFIELKPQTIPLNSNAFEMQLRKHHYQKKHADFIKVFDEIIKNKTDLKEKPTKKLNWKWYHVIQKQDLQNKFDSVCVFSN